MRGRGLTLRERALIPHKPAVWHTCLMCKTSYYTYITWAGNSQVSQNLILEMDWQASKPKPTCVWGVAEEHLGRWCRCVGVSSHRRGGEGVGGSIPVLFVQLDRVYSHVHRLFVPAKGIQAVSALPHRKGRHLGTIGTIGGARVCVCVSVCV